MATFSERWEKLLSIPTAEKTSINIESMPREIDTDACWDPTAFEEIHCPPTWKMTNWNADNNKSVVTRRLQDLAMVAWDNESSDVITTIPNKRDFCLLEEGEWPFHDSSPCVLFGKTATNEFWKKQHLGAATTCAREPEEALSQAHFIELQSDKHLGLTEPTERGICIYWRQDSFDEDMAAATSKRLPNMDTQRDFKRRRSCGIIMEKSKIGDEGADSVDLWHGSFSRRANLTKKRDDPLRSKSEHGLPRSRNDFYDSSFSITQPTKSPVPDFRKRHTGETSHSEIPGNYEYSGAVLPSIIYKESNTRIKVPQQTFVKRRCNCHVASNIGDRANIRTSQDNKRALDYYDSEESTRAIAAAPDVSPSSRRLPTPIHQDEEVTFEERYKELTDVRLTNRRLPDLFHHGEVATLEDMKNAANRRFLHSALYRHTLGLRFAVLREQIGLDTTAERKSKPLYVAPPSTP